MTTFATSRVRTLHKAGVSVWLDDLSRRLLDDGTLECYIAEHAVSGVTSNPTIFAAALSDTDRYQPHREALRAAGVRDPRALFFALALEDVADAARLLRRTYEHSAGRDGYVSFECTPDVADDTTATVRQAQSVWERARVPNLMIKVPGTTAGIAAIEELTYRGVNVNVTLLFSATQYEQAARAYFRGLQRRLADGASVESLRSVASLFISRLDARVAAVPGIGTSPGAPVAVNAHHVYRSARHIFSGPEWDLVHAHGAHWQRPLWASTANKNPAQRDVLYVESLALADSIVTVPETTLLAFADHGNPKLTDANDGHAATLLAAGTDLEAIGSELQGAGLRAFADAFDIVLERLGDAGKRRVE